MNVKAWKGIVAVAVVAALCGAAWGITKAEVRKQMEGVKKAYEQGLLTEERYKQKIAMLEEELKKAPETETAVVEKEEAVELIQNGSFEEYNANSNPDQTRWQWWSGWKWDGDYQNNKSEDAQDGKLSAEVKCTGKKGRIGLFTPEIPIMKKNAEYELSLWIKGTEGNRLNVSFEGGAKGDGAFTGTDQWTKVTVKAKADPDAKAFRVYLYTVGTGTLLMDNVSLIQK